MFGRIGNRRNAHNGKKHRLLKAKNERCGVNMESLVERLSRYGKLDWYNYQDLYWGREEEYMKELYRMLEDPDSMDMVISDIEQFLDEAEDWTPKDFEVCGMSEAEIRSTAEDLKRLRRCFP